MRDPAMGEPRKRVTRMRYTAGPMAFLADQIMKELQRAGYPPVEFNLYRSPEMQRKYYGVTSRASPYNSAHQYYCASDIIHERWAWFAAKDAPSGDAFWDRLWDCSQVVSEKFGVEFSPRLRWDPAHVQLDCWRDFKSLVGSREPTSVELDAFFAKVLPSVWKQHLACQAKKLTP